jgi:pimeloyl-ACP methyl ester carboxylesterase
VVRRRKSTIRIERIWASVDGVAVHARWARPPRNIGLARPIVLVHGLGMSSRYMLPLLRLLAHETEVYAVDLPGYGRSGDPAHPLRLDGLADALEHWMATVGINEAIVAGNSLGAQIVLHLATKYPARVERAVLIGATHDPASGGPWEHLLRLVLDGLRERPSLLWVAATDYLRAGPVGMFTLLREALKSPEEAELRQLRVPTLVVRGSRDPISTQPWNEEIVRLLPDARLTVIEGTAHAVNFSGPEPLAREIMAFGREQPAVRPEA